MPTPHVPATTPPSSPNVPVQEAHWMLDQGIQPDSNCASRGIGYRQALAALQHWRAHPGDLQPSQLVLTLDFSWHYGLLSISTLSCSACNFLAMLPQCACVYGTKAFGQEVMYQLQKLVDKTSCTKYKSLWTKSLVASSRCCSRLCRPCLAIMLAVVAGTGHCVMGSAVYILCGRCKW